MYLNKSKQVLFGKDEVSDVYDYNNASDTNNYVLVMNKPDRWDDECERYYLKSEDEKYSPVQKEEVEESPGDRGCSKCGKIALDDEKFCTNCGNKI